MAQLNRMYDASFSAEKIGRYRYTVTAWVDPFLTWREEFVRREDVADLRIAAQIGAELIEAAAERIASALQATQSSIALSNQSS